MKCKFLASNSDSQGWLSTLHECNLCSTDLQKKIAPCGFNETSNSQGWEQNRPLFEPRLFSNTITLHEN